MYIIFDPDECTLHIEGNDEHMFNDMEALGVSNVTSDTVHIPPMMFTVYYEDNQSENINNVGFQPHATQYFRGVVVIQSDSKPSDVLNFIKLKNVLDGEFEKEYDTLVGSGMIEKEVVTFE